MSSLWIVAENTRRDDLRETTAALTPPLDDGIVVCARSGATIQEVLMDVLTVPAPVRQKLGDAGTDGLVTMFADAHRIGTAQLDRRMAEVSASFDRKLAEASTRFDRKLADEISKFRVEMVERMSDLRFDLLKWNFLFWIGQLAAMTAILSVMLRGLR